MKKFLMLFVLIIPYLSLAGVDKLMKYASPDGSMSNVNKPEVIEDQSGGFVTGGSIIMRGPRPQVLQPFHVETPSFKYDPCSGNMDFRFGSFSFIKSSEFAKFFKKIPQAAGGYAIKMGIKTFCPQCETIMTELETVARTINGMMMDQCALSQKLGEGMVSKLNSAGKQRCLMQSNIGKFGQDQAENMQTCSSDQSKYGDQGEEEMKSMLGNEFNLAWKALTKNGTDIGNKDFLELMMSISGTLIGKKGGGGKWTFTHKPSLFTDSKQIENYIGSTSGSSIDIYSCSENKKCLNVATSVKNLGNDTFFSQVDKLITSITGKIADNKNKTTLSEDESSLISFSSIPIITLIEQDLVQKGVRSSPVVSNYELVEVICYDMVSNYLQSLLNTTKKEIKSLELGSNEPSIIENFTKDLESIRRIINDHKITAYNRATIAMQAKEHMEQKTLQIRGRFSRVLTTYNKNQ
jgi:conjugative transfer pilus assembly protein TraH